MTKIPTGVHPFTRWFFEELNRQKTSMHEVAERSGVLNNNLHGWRRHQPTLPLMDAALQTLGYRLAIVPLAHPQLPGMLDQYTAAADKREQGGSRG